MTHNRPDYLRQVVHALCTQTLCPAVIVVFDNACDIPAAEVLRDFTAVTCVRSEINLGGAGGFAQGIHHAAQTGCDWLWLMDDDAVPRPDALERLCQATQQLPKHAAAVCSSVFEFNRLARMHRRNFHRWSGIETRVPLRSYQQAACAIDMASFVGFMVRTQTVATVGLPDAQFFLAYDDTEYSLRLRAAHWSIWLVPDSAIDHLRGAGSRLSQGPFSAKHFYNIRNRIHVARRYASAGGVATAIACGLLVWIRAQRPFAFSTLALCARAIRDGLQGKLGPITSGQLPSTTKPTTQPSAAPPPAKAGA